MNMVGRFEVMLSCLSHDDVAAMRRRRFGAITALLVLILVSLVRTYGSPAGGAAVVLGIGSPVQHGAQQANQAATALRGPGCSTWCDRRLARGLHRMEHDFPSLSPFSLSRHVSPRDLWAALRASRPFLRSARRTALGCGRAEWLYLLLAQGARLSLAERRLRSSGARLVIVDFDRSSAMVPLVMAARNAGVPSATLVHGSPSKTYLPVLADVVLAWSTTQADWFRTQGVPDVEVVGRLGARSAAPTPDANIWTVLSSKEELTDTEVGRLLDVVGEAARLGQPSVLRLHPLQQPAQLGTGWAQVAAVVDSCQRPMSAAGWTAQTARAIGVSSTALIDALDAGCAVQVLADADRELPVEIEWLRRHQKDPERVAESSSAGREALLPFEPDEVDRRLAGFVERFLDLEVPSNG